VGLAGDHDRGDAGADSLGRVDLMTAGPNDFRISVLTATLGDLPLAAVLIAGTLRLIRFTAIRVWLLEPTTPLWRLPLLP
jgi:hypothetical protein